MGSTCDGWTAENESKGFEDRFSAQAAAYARHRPVYPPELYSFLAKLAPGQTCAWDCGCGNGQAAVAVRKHFDHVVATDASAAQIERAQTCPGVEYRVARSEESGLPDTSVQLVTAASALHWFDLPAFYREVRRVLVPRGVIAAWGYREAVIAPGIDELINDYQNRIVDEFWSSRIRIVANGYERLDFPFEEVAAPPMDVRATWTADQMLGYLGTWSASQSYLERHGTPATALIEEELRERWGAGARAVRWPLTARVGRTQ
ncbi:MAG: class I SAM-dependent methyltransferase [Phycisphaerales bacterium]